MNAIDQTIEQTAEMLRLGYSEHEIVRILRIPMFMADKVIESADSWNYERDMAQGYVDPDTVSSLDAIY
jgi:hypothetical protein